MQPPPSLKPAERDLASPAGAAMADAAAAAAVADAEPPSIEEQPERADYGRSVLALDAYLRVLQREPQIYNTPNWELRAERGAEFEVCSEPCCDWSPAAWPPASRPLIGCMHTLLDCCGARLLGRQPSMGGCQRTTSLAATHLGTCTEHST